MSTLELKKTARGGKMLRRLLPIDAPTPLKGRKVRGKGPAAPAANPTQQLLDSIKGLGERIGKQETAIEGLLKAVAAPASKAGLSPQEFLAKMTQGGTPFVIGHDGVALPVVQRGQPRTSGIGKYLLAMAKMARPGVVDMDVETAAKLLVDGKFTKAALAEGSGVTGGYTVPPDFSAKLMMAALEDAIMQPRAYIQPMTSLTAQLPYLDQTTAQAAGTTAFLGGILASWASEAQLRNETEPTFRMFELKAHELSFYCVASNTLLADSAIALDALLTQLFTGAASWYPDYAFLQGDGVGKPLGILNAPASIAISRANANKVQLADLATMMGRLLKQSWKSAFWVMHQTVLPQLIQLADAGGGLVWVDRNSGAANGLPMTVLGLPVLFTEKVPALGTKGDCMLVDASMYVVGDRQDTQIEVSPHVKFLNNQMVWRVVKRLDGQPWLSGPITLANAVTTVSPFIILN